MFTKIIARGGANCLRSSQSRLLSTAAPRLNSNKTPKFDPAAAATNEIEIRIEPLPRPNEPTEKKRARLLYQSRKRGILETDLLMSRFAKAYLKDMTRAELDEFDEMLDEHDWDLYYWATETAAAPKPCPERWQKSELFAKLKKLSKNEEHEILRMPPLN